MDNGLRNLINNLTEDIIRSFEIQIPILHMEQVVEQLGGRVEETYDLSVQSDGHVQKQGDGFVIYVSPFQTEERKKFTIAHELGHLFLHMGYMINEELWRRQDDQTYHRQGGSAMEYQANEFAAAFLMPKNKYKEIMDQYTEGNIVETRQIARYFGVSISAASNRGKFLGYLAW